jgi:hypothetical protein
VYLAFLGCGLSYSVLSFTSFALAHSVAIEESKLYKLRAQTSGTPVYAASDSDGIDDLKVRLLESLLTVGRGRRS